MSSFLRWQSYSLKNGVTIAQECLLILGRHCLTPVPGFLYLFSGDEFSLLLCVLCVLFVMILAQNFVPKRCLLNRHRNHSGPRQRCHFQLL